jgi:crotonobetainyl-CoA:carnitine CoA-transferase CaiB-like acyl-CoA transferase
VHHLLGRASIPCAPVNGVALAIRPQVQVREKTLQHDHRSAGPDESFNISTRLGDVPVDSTHCPPRHGEPTDEAQLVLGTGEPTIWDGRAAGAIR